jgi:hypothetical protein
MNLYWRVFNFFVRRVVAVGFMVIGLVIAIGNSPSLLPGHTIDVNGTPNDDIVMRCIAVFLPLVAAVLGLLLFRAKPYDPSKAQ